MKRFLTVAVAMLALTGMGQVAMRKLEDLTNTNLVCVTDYGPQLVSVTGGLASISGAVAVIQSDLPGLATTQQVEAAAAALAVHTNRTDNPHGVTAAQIGALTAEQDLAALRAYHYGSPDIVESPAEWFAFDGAGTITAFNWEAGRENVVIPWAIGGVPVTTIGANAFQASGIVSLIAPQTVKTIGNSAFNSCLALTSPNLPQVTLIGPSAFNRCSALSSVTLPQAQMVGLAAFYKCHALTSVRMGQNAPAEVVAVFADITPPPTVYVTNPQATGWGDTWNGAPVVRPPLYGSNVTAQAFTLNGDTITEWPVGGATNITDGVTSGTYSEATRTLNISNLLAGVSVELPDGIVTNEQDLAALRTYHYGSPDIVESPEEWFGFDGAGTITLFNWEAGRTNVVIPWAIGGVPVTAIGANAFQASGIVSVIAPQTVKTIGIFAFADCYSLTSVTIPQATAIGSSAFNNCGSLSSVSLPQATAIGGSAFAYCTALASIDLPQATSIGDYAFYSCGSLSSVIAPQATSIGSSAFNNCGSLSSVSLPQATSIGDFAFADCYSLTSVTIPQATAIGSSAFNSCGSLSSVIAPQATSIGDFAFNICGSLSSVSLPQATSIGDFAFNTCDSLSSVSLPQATAIGDYAFYDCTSLTAVHMGQNAPAEASYVFAGITPPPNVYVTDPQATGWGDTWNGVPVVRPNLYGSNVTAQAFTLGGDTITEWPVGGGETSIIAPLYESGTNVTVTSTQSVYSVSVTGAGPVGIDWSGLALDGTGRAEITLRLNVTEWAGTNVTFSPALTFDRTPEILVTGVWEFAASTIDGVTTRVRQTWPETVAWSRMQRTFGMADTVGTWTSAGVVGQTNVTFYVPACTALCMVRHVASVVHNGTSATFWIMPMRAGNTAFDASKCVATNSITDASIGTQFEYRAVVDFGAQYIRGVGLWTALTYGNIYLHYTKQESRPLNANERAAYAAGWRP